jgi:hypothetical protein
MILTFAAVTAGLATMAIVFTIALPGLVVLALRELSRYVARRNRGGTRTSSRCLA